MKRLVALLALATLLSAAFAEPTEAPAPSEGALVSFRTEYRSPNKLDVGYYSFEGAFVARLPRSRLVIDPKEKTEGAIVLKLLCDPIGQMMLNGVAYKLWNARLRASLRVLGRDGALLFAKDFELVKGAGADSRQAEINALENAKKKIGEYVEANGAELAAALASLE